MLKHDMIIHRDESTYSAFPEVIRRRSGEIQVRFGEIPLERLKGHRANWAHYGFGAEPRCLSSSDGGQTWLPGNGEGNDFAVFGAHITRLASGDWLAAGFRYKLASSERELGDCQPRRSLPGGLWAGNLGAYVIRSSDEGITWGEPTWVRRGPVYPFGDLIELPDGPLLMVAYGRPKEEPADVSFMLKSEDGGCNWEDFSTIAADPAGKIHYQEPACIHLGQGKMLTMMRTGGAGGFLYQSTSADGGASWEAPRDTGVWGHPAHLLRLKSGTLLCVYGYRQEPFGIRACLSHDEGETWNLANERVLRDDGGGWDLGYPRCVQLDDGSVLAVYYFNQGGDCRFIAATLFQE